MKRNAFLTARVLSLLSISPVTRGNVPHHSNLIVALASLTFLALFSQ